MNLRFRKTHLHLIIHCSAALAYRCFHSDRRVVKDLGVGLRGDCFVGWESALVGDDGCGDTRWRPRDAFILSALPSRLG